MPGSRLEGRAQAELREADRKEGGMRVMKSAEGQASDMVKQGSRVCILTGIQ